VGDAAAGGFGERGGVQPDRKCETIQFVAYRRHMKRKISSEMQSRVDETVSKYVEFYSERRK
jgi:hypothetical protein